MKNITTKQFQILKDIDLVWDFMTDIYKPRFANGAAAPFFEYAITSSWMNKDYTHLYRFWLDSGKVAGFVFAEDPVTNIFFNLRPSYEELADEIIEYAENSFPDFGDGIEPVIFSGQTALIQAAALIFTKELVMRTAYTGFIIKSGGFENAEKQFRKNKACGGKRF